MKSPEQTTAPIVTPLIFYMITMEVKVNIQDKFRVKLPSSEFDSHQVYRWSSIELNSNRQSSSESTSNVRLSLKMTNYWFSFTSVPIKNWDAGPFKKTIWRKKSQKGCWSFKRMASKSILRSSNIWSTTLWIEKWINKPNQENRLWSIHVMILSKWLIQLFNKTQSEQKNLCQKLRSFFH